MFRIETSRLWLRWPRASDARALHQVAGSAVVAEMTATWPHPLPDTEADRRILKAREGNAAGSNLVMAITRKKSADQLIGIVGVTPSDDGQLALGYLLSEAHQGRGLVTEAVLGLARAVFTSTPYSLIRASSRTINPASRRVLEKAGFGFVGTSMLAAAARGGNIAVDDFELSRSGWLQGAIQGRLARGWPAAPRGASYAPRGSEAAAA